MNYYQVKNLDITRANNILQEQKTLFEQEYARVYNSRSYKLGRVLSFPYRRIRGGIKCYHEHGIKYTLKRCSEKFKYSINCNLSKYFYRKKMLYIRNFPYKKIPIM